MPKKQLYPVNPDRTQPWNDIPVLPVHPDLYRDVEIYEKLGNAKEAPALLALLAGRTNGGRNVRLLLGGVQKHR